MALAPLASVWLIGATLLMGVYVNPSHAVLIDLPRPSVDGEGKTIALAVDVLAIDAIGTLVWNGRLTDGEGLQAHLERKRRQLGPSGLRFAPDRDAPYEAVLHALAMVKATGNAEAGFCFEGIAAHRRFGKAASPERPTGEPEPPCDPRTDGRFDAPLPYMPTTY